jgi:hypothetical protein
MSWQKYNYSFDVAQGWRLALGNAERAGRPIGDFRCGRPPCPVHHAEKRSIEPQGAAEMRVNHVP